MGKIITLPCGISTRVEEDKYNEQTSTILVMLYCISRINSKNSESEAERNV
jgi:hypothetical protein